MTVLNIRRFLVVILDCLALMAAFVGAFLIRFEFFLDSANIGVIAETLPLVLLAHLLTAVPFSLYRGLYYFSSFSDLMNITKAAVSGGIVGAALILFVRQGKFPRSILILYPVLAFLGICWIRFSIRLVKNHLRLRGAHFGDGRSVLLVGAGELGESVLRQILKTPSSGYYVVGLIDDDRAKWGMNIHGYPVLGGRADLRQVLEKHNIDEIIITIAMQRGEIVRSVIELLKEVEPKPEIKIAPGLDEMLRSSRQGISVRKVRPADLLNRSEIALDEVRIARAVEGKSILVTGAGGTIGAELCRQVIGYRPEKVVMIENHATSLFYRSDELRTVSQGTAVVPVLGDIRDNGMLERVFSRHHPDMVFHAAAHKHVHQLELNVPEGISNNILGTAALARAAARWGVGTFLLISTDKAVQPSSVMGATKCAAEALIEHLAKSSKTRFVGVRFGNVLGSSGSVLRIFNDQIEKGGPVTVTDERATRYFMTVEESIGLVLQAVSMAKGGEVFVLRMGTPVRILDMAKNLILLCGLEPGKDIEIKITGLKQGEKLDEQLTDNPQNLGKSPHPDVFLLQEEPRPAGNVDELVSALEELSRGSDVDAMIRKLQEIVPTFTPAGALLPSKFEKAGK